jgi:hypothetical protein
MRDLAGSEIRINLCRDVRSEHTTPWKDPPIGQSRLRIIATGIGGEQPAVKMVRLIGPQTHPLRRRIDPVRRMLGAISEAGPQP